jgi:hypothetical protein
MEILEIYQLLKLYKIVKLRKLNIQILLLIEIHIDFFNYNIKNMIFN